MVAEVLAGCGMNERLGSVSVAQGTRGCWRIGIATLHGYSSLRRSVHLQVVPRADELTL